MRPRLDLGSPIPGDGGDGNASLDFGFFQRGIHWEWWRGWDNEMLLTLPNEVPKEVGAGSRQIRSGLLEQ